MARPLVIFPIFAPYRCWMSSVDHGMPMNRFVLERLLKVDPASQPFLCVQACNKYLTWRAPTLSSDLDYNKVARTLETALLWSFSRRISLLRLSSELAFEFLEFWTHPPAHWTTRTPFPRFVPQTGVPFSEWPINKKWRLFKRRLGANGKYIAPVEHSRQVLVRELKQLYDVVEASSPRPDSQLSPELNPRPNPFADIYGVNAAGEYLDALEIRQDSTLLSQHQLDWLMETVHLNGLTSARWRELAIVLMLARETTFSFRAIVGGDLNKASISQFQPVGNGLWAYSVTGALIKDDFHTLPRSFTPQFETHLKRMGVDPSEPLPSRPLFPQRNPAFGYSADALWGHLSSLRRELANAAASSAKQEIRDGARKLARLSFGLVRRSARALRRK